MNCSLGMKTKSNKPKASKLGFWEAIPWSRLLVWARTCSSTQPPSLLLGFHFPSGIKSDSLSL